MSFFKKFGSHFAIERFGIIFLSLTILLGVDVATIVGKKVALDHQSLSGRAVYTSSFSMSQSGTTGKVVGLYGNEEHTKAFLLLSFDDMSMMSTKADDYSILLGGSDTSGYYQETKSHPSGILYMFPQAGYMGIYLQDNNGFPSQILQIQISSVANLKGTEAQEKDKCAIFFNPGGTDIEIGEFLKTSDWEIFDMVEEVISRSQEATLRNTLSDDLKQMADKQTIAQIRLDRLRDDYDVIIPTIPNIVDDEVYAVAADGSTDEHLHFADSSYGSGWFTPDETKAFKEEDVKFYITSKSLIPGGFDFNWQDGRILTGYLKELTGTTDSNIWNQYVNGSNNIGEITTANSEATLAQRQTQEQFENELDNLSWTKSNGTAIIVSKTAPNTDSSGQDVGIVGDDAQIQNDISLVLSSWRDYYDLKVKYETVDLPALLNLEIQCNTVLDVYDVNDDKDMLTVV